MGKYTTECPRCGGCLETLKSYAHCSSCLYYEDYWYDTESAFNLALKCEKEISRYQEEIEQNQEDSYEEKDCA